jgi:hypothetical protein
MSVRPQLTVVLNRNTTAALAEELREPRQLAKDRRTASLALFRRAVKRPAFRSTDPPRRRTPLALTRLPRSPGKGFPVGSSSLLKNR